MIFVECKPDEVLIRTLGVPRTRLRHVHDKPRVIKLVRRRDGSTGMIDEDPTSAQPGFLKEFKEVGVEHRIKLLRHSEKGSRLIVLCPRLEEWIIAAAEEAGVDPRRYGLPNDAAGLKRVINHQLNEYRKLVEEVLDKGSQRLGRLKALLSGSLG
ncbi:MAG TPA: hypothetical protein ENF73_00345 [Proteobacteria bacterium]|nr:hypothetical protein [Pseudomonadota bacterium]